MQLPRSYTYFLILLFCAAAPLSASAAELIIQVPRGVVAVGDEITVPVLLRSAGAHINAVEGNIIIPPDLLSVRALHDGNSAVNVWVEPPHITAPGSVRFSGFTPGGFARSEELIFSLVLRSEHAGTASLMAQNLRALKNDGFGGSVLISALPTTLSIDATLPRSQMRAPVMDTEAPEPFQPIIVRDHSSSGLVHFLVFMTHDKGSGIDHYEVREGWLGPFVPAVSPHRVTDEWLVKKIFVKAIDRSGNERVVSIIPPLYQQIKLLLLILCAILVSAFFVVRLWQKHSRY